LQLTRLEEADMAPNWYEPGAGKSKKRKASAATTKDLEKKRKAAMTAAPDNDDTKGKPSQKR